MNKDVIRMMNNERIVSSHRDASAYNTEIYWTSIPNTTVDGKEKTEGVQRVADNYGYHD